MSEQTVVVPTVEVPLGQIDPNPYQMRLEENPQAVEEIALSIYRNGLLQIPAAQQKGGRYVLAFGHTRKAAFQLLATKGLPDHDIAGDPQKWGAMPLRLVKDLDDRRMFELALTENMKRQDLNPIEVARALQRYMTEFKATSDEAGELFGLKGTTVRGKVRLLDLPEFVQEQVSQGAVAESDARKLVTVSRVLPEKQVRKVVEDIRKGSDPDKALEGHLRETKAVVRMSHNWYGEDQKNSAGEDLWELDGSDFPQDRLPALDKGSMTGLLERELAVDEIAALDGWLPQLAAGVDPSALIAENPKHEDLLEQVRHLAAPPTCLQCPFYMRVDGDHYCGWAACHARKKEAYLGWRLEQLSKKLKIAIYDKARDGKAKKLNTYDGSDKKLFTDRNTDLRLKLGKENSYSQFSGLPSNIVVVMTGAVLEKQKAKLAKRNNGADSWELQQEERRRKTEQEQRRRLATFDFLWKECAPALAKCLKNFDHLPALLALGEATRAYERPKSVKAPGKSASRSDKLNFLRLILAYDLLLNDVPFRRTEERLKDAVYQAAAHAAGFAKAWGANLPAGFLDRAKAVDAEILIAEGETVSAETGSSKKAKAKK